MAKRIHFFMVIGPVCSWEKDLLIRHILSNT